jgi:Ras-related protein Rab-1A
MCECTDNEKNSFDNDEKIRISNSNYDHLYKILIIGDSCVGKSSLIKRFSDNHFDECSIQTNGVDFKTRNIEINGDICKLQIWDTVSQERFRILNACYYKGANGILIVYDITNECSFNNISKWLQDVQKYAQPNVLKMIIGNKIDCEDKRSVSYIRADNYAKEFNMPYFETSAKTDINVGAIFMKLSHLIAEATPS